MDSVRSYGGYTLGELMALCMTQDRKRYERAAAAALPFLLARMCQLLEEADATEALETDERGPGQTGDQGGA